MRGKSTLKQIARSISAKLADYCVNKPPSKVELFQREEAKELMGFWVLSVFRVHSLLEKQLSSKAVMHLSTFKMFRRNNPINLPLDSGEEIQNPLLIPFLR